MKKTLLALASFAMLATGSLSAQESVPSGVILSPASGSEFDPGQFPATISMTASSATWVTFDDGSSQTLELAKLTGPEGFRTVSTYLKPASASFGNKTMTISIPDASSITLPGTYTLTIDCSHLTDLGNDLGFDKVVAVYTVKEGEVVEVKPENPEISVRNATVVDGKITIPAGGWAQATLTCPTASAEIYYQWKPATAVVDPGYSKYTGNPIGMTVAGVLSYYAQNGSMKSDICTLTVEVEPLKVPVASVEDKQIVDNTVKIKNGETLLVTLNGGGAYVWYKWADAENPSVTEEFSQYDAPIEITAPGTLSYYGEINGYESEQAVLHVVLDTEVGISGVSSESAEAEYFDLNGRRVLNPVNGIYIVRNGDKIRKAIIK